MKRDWLDIFLPLWAVGSTAWVITGFSLLPVAFRRPLLYSPHGVWTSSLFDVTRIDWEVARALSIVIGPPGLVVIIAMIVVACEMIWGRRRPKPRPGAYR
jgi:hypothetical protein